MSIRATLANMYTSVTSKHVDKIMSVFLF